MLRQLLVWKTHHSQRLAISQAQFNEIFTPNPTVFSIADTTLSVGGAGMTITGTPFSLLNLGNDVAGSSTADLAEECSEAVNSKVALTSTSSGSPKGEK